MPNSFGNRNSAIGIPHTRVAQPVERATVNRVVGGSSPSAGAEDCVIRSRLANRLRRSPPQGEGAGSSPAESNEEIGECQLPIAE